MSSRDPGFNALCVQAAMTDVTTHSNVSLASRAAALARDVRDIASDHLELAVLEAQRAGIGLAKMVAAVVVIAVLVVSAWLGLLASGVAWAAASGISWIAALAIAAVANLVIAGLVGVWMRAQGGELLFAATLRQLRRDAHAVEEVR